MGRMIGAEDGNECRVGRQNPVVQQKLVCAGRRRNGHAARRYRTNICPRGRRNTLAQSDGRSAAGDERWGFRRYSHLHLETRRGEKRQPRPSTQGRRRSIRPRPPRPNLTAGPAYEHMILSGMRGGQCGPRLGLEPRARGLLRWRRRRRGPSRGQRDGCGRAS